MIHRKNQIATKIFVVFFLFLLSSSYSQPNQKFLVRITPEKTQLEMLKNLQLEYAYKGLKNHVDVIIDSEQLEIIKEKGFRFQVLPSINKANLYDPEYHTYEEVVQELTDLHQSYPEITAIHQIGVSQQFQIPIYAIKISDNAAIDEDEFTVNYDGVHHAREPMGLESCMVLINYLLENYGVDSLITEIINNVEIWITPILNTEGYKYLVDNDLSNPWWRKNQRDNNENGEFDPDQDGVDLNRNYDYRFTMGGSSDFSSWTYRGPYPFSESEVAAKRDLTLRERFLCSITYHSYAEEIYYMRGLEGRTLPETPILDAFADSIAARIPRLYGNGHYQAGGSTNSSNMSYPWMFAVAGVYEFLIETGTEFIPPGPVGIQVAQDNLSGALYLLEKTISGPGIRGHIKDAVTDSPIVANVKILEYYRSSMTPRKNEAQFGRFHRFAAPGTYTLEIIAPRYARKIVEQIVVNNSGWTDVDVLLDRGATPVVDSYIIDDDSTGESLGNNNGEANIGERIELTIGLKNIGFVNADSVTAKLISQNYFANVIQDQQQFGAIPIDSVVSSQGSFIIELDNRIPDATDISFKLVITGAQNLYWEDEFTIPVYAPVINLQKVTVNDSLANNNRALEPGETVDLTFFLTNNGHMDAHDVRTTLAVSGTYISIIAGVDTAKVVSVGDTATLRFRVKLDEATPEPYIALFNIVMLSREKYLQTQHYRLMCLAGFFDNMEFGENGWWSEVRNNPKNPHNDWQWGMPRGKAEGQDPAYAYSGIYCWGNDLGDEGWNGFYQHDVNIYLNSPVIDCRYYSKVGLKFMRQLNVRNGDVATVLVNNQIVWSSPSSGLYDNSWTEQIIDISAIADSNPNVIISFGLTSNGSGWAGGWNIDDVLVMDQLATSIQNSENQTLPVTSFLFQNYPNPFNPSTTIQYQLAENAKVSLKILNLLGQQVKQLVDQKMTKGRYTVIWDGKNDSGSFVASGIYLMQFVVENQGIKRYQQTQKILMVK